MIRNRCAAALVLATLIAPLPVTAADAQAGDMFHVRGFGTFGFVHSSDRNADFVANPFQPTGSGHSRGWDGGVDSKLALQLDAELSDSLSAVVQLVAQRRYDGTFTPQVEWANVKYAFSPDLSVRLGRTALGTFLVSDARLLGYANPWVRPPLELYGLLPVTNTDGVDGSYRFLVGKTTHTSLLSYGRTHLRLPGGGDVHARKIVAFNHKVEHGALMLRGAYLRAQVDVETPGLDSLFDGLTQFGGALSMVPGLEPIGAQSLALADRYRFVDRRITATTLGVVYDGGPWLLMAEWGRLKGPPLLAQTSAWSATIGRRFGEFTPYLTFAERDGEALNEPGISTLGLPPPLAQGAAALNAGLHAAQNQFVTSQRSASAGLRWEVWPEAALKLQYDHITRGAGSVGTFVNAQSGLELGGSANVVSISLDVVF